VTNPASEPNASVSDPSPPDAATRFAVLGTGRITRRLVADLQSTPGVRVTAIASRSQQRSEWFASQYGIQSAVEGYQSALQRDDVDAVYIALPPAMHAEWCVRAAEAGKTILCEKPLATSAAEAVAIRDACAKHAVRWLDATAWLHHRRTGEMIALARDGQIGRLGHITASISFYRPFQSGEHRLDAGLGGGCLLDLGWYASGLICHFADRMPTKVYADAIVESGVPIRVNGMLWFDDHLTAGFSCGYDTATRKWFEVAGSEASIICDDFTRPWADRAPRFWVHDAGGNVQSHQFADRQEQRMIETLVGSESLDAFHAIALRTQHVVDALAESVSRGETVAPQPIPPR
jgi:predicted dehydrogenase